MRDRVRQLSHRIRRAYLRWLLYKVIIATNSEDLVEFEVGVKAVELRNKTAPPIKRKDKDV